MDYVVADQLITLDPRPVLAEPVGPAYRNNESAEAFVTSIQYYKASKYL
jgi:hypothetical protein